MNTLIILIAQYAIFVVPIFVLIACATMPLANRKQFIVTFVLGMLFGYMLLRLASGAFYDPRPFTVSGINALFPHIADNGFPSDHTIIAALAAFIVFAFSRRIGVILVVLSVLIGTARVLAHVHSWVDIVGAIIVAFIAAVLAYLAVHLMINRSANDNINLQKETQ
ncbi:MAG: protein tyrosine/serine phosphatase [Candidatus Saccharibacteria bacterium]|nr:protein tyrosine/serine phosphatase [Candidatus Saccharibacteria bacterium]